MKFDDKHTFDKPAATVMTMFTDRDYFERKYKALGFTDIHVIEHDKSGDRFRIKVRYTASNEVALPEFARKFIPSAMVLTQQDTWDLKRMTGRIDVEIRGTPLNVACEMSLKDEPKGSANHLKWTVSCGIPLVGGKLEQLMADTIKAKAGDDVATTRRILADY